MPLEPVPDSDARVGDLVFAAPKFGDPLGAMIVDLDGSPYSHVGIVCRPGAMASCRADLHGFRDDADIGGVCIDTFAELRDAGRELHLARTTKTDAERSEALRIITSLVDDQDDHRSSFSFAKLFMVAAALNTYVPGEAGRAPERATMLAAAVDGAEAWRWESMRHPGFFCAEFVAVAYSAEFSIDDLTPLRPRGPEDGWPSRARELAQRVWDEIPSREQAFALLRLVRTVAEHDRAFLGRAAGFLVTMIEQSRGRARGADDMQVAPSSDGATLPSALVTPRMLARADWIDGAIEPMHA